MAYNTNYDVLAIPLDEVDKVVDILEGTFTVPAGAAGTQGIVYISHDHGQALLPEGYFSAISSNVTVPPNYQGDGVTVNLACSSTNVILSYVKNSSATGTVSYYIKLIAKN